MSKKPHLKQDQKPTRNSLEIQRPNISMNLLDEEAKQQDRRMLHKLNCSATYGRHNRANTDGDLSAGVTAQLKNCVRQQLQLKRPVDLKLFAKRQTGSLYTGFEPINGKQRPTHAARLGDRRKSAYEEILQGDRIKRFHTEKISLNPSQKNILKRRKLSFGKDSQELGRSSELKKYYSGVDERRRSVKSIDKNQNQTLYNRAVDLLSQNKVKQAIKDFQSLINQGSSFKSNSYLWLSICYKKLNKLEQAIDVLNRTLIEYPKHYEAYIYRSKLFTKTKKFDRAKKDVNSAISIDPDKPLAYMAKGDCLRANNEFREAEKAYEQAIKCEKVDPSMIYLKKIQMEIEQIQYEHASKDIEELLLVQPSNSQALSFKGIVQKQQGLLVEAALTFEQSLKHNNSRKGVSRALYELVKMKMEQRDYYEAYYALSRSEHLDVDANLLENFRLFNEAAILLMKRKFQQAIKVFHQLETLRETFDDFLLPLFRQFKAYGYFCLGRHKEAANEYKRLDHQTKDDISTYNHYLCEGIIEVEQGHYNNGTEYFNKAKEVFPNKVEPYIYIAVTYVREANDAIRAQNSPENEKRRQTAVIRAMDEMNSGHLINDANSNLLYHRTILSYYFKDFKGGLEDINRCIQKAEDNISKYFYLRGLGYACSKDLIKAVNEFSICTSLDKNYASAYVQRAKCLFLLGDTDKAFMDLHSYMELQSKDMNIHKWIGDLLFESKSYSDALKTYCEMEDVHQSQQLLLMRVKCHVRLGMLEEARADLNRLAKIGKKFSRSNRIDMNALALLNGLMNRQSANRIGSSVKKLNQGLEQDIKGEVFKLIDCMMLIGIAAAHIGKYADASSSFTLVRQLFEVNSKRNKCEIKSEMSEEHLNLSLKKVNFNLFIMKIAEKKFQQATEFVRSQLIPLLDSSEREVFYLLLSSYELNEQSQRSIILSKKNEIAYKFEPMQFQIGSVLLKTKLMQGIFHEICNELYHYNDAIGMIGLLTPSYVENKPEAPWIRRNTYGVVFTENMLRNESIKLQTTQLEKSEANNRVFESHRSEDRKDDLRHFKQKIKLDDRIQQKLNRMLQKTSETK